MNIKNNDKNVPCTTNFIRYIIDEDILNNKNNGKVITRFPPEPNGYLHIGHAKSICLNFGIAKDYKGICHLRFDDTNPAKEEQEYVDSIQEDVLWLGFDWKDKLFFASDYYDKCYDYALELIKKGKAYVCSLSAEEVRQYRGTLKEPGTNSPYRERKIEENLFLFEKMKNGEMNEGDAVLRAKIDMSSPNLNMRDPALYRIKKVSHHRTKDKWCIYPMYDYAHPISDALEGITHSICTLEFEDHRPLYEWVLNNITIQSKPQQIEFARLNLTYTVMSKRKLLELVEEKIVLGWDDPRMPTIQGMRRRGFTPSSIQDFCDRIGVGKVNSTVDYALLEHCLREDLNKSAKRVMAVLNPLKVIIDNYPEDKVEEFEGENNPEDLNMGKRNIPFSKIIYIEREDFEEVPPKNFYRLAPGLEVRLKHAYYIKCLNYKKDDKTGEILEVHCIYDEATRGGWSNDGRKVKGTLHWVSKNHAVKGEVRIFDNLFNKENPDDAEDGKTYRDYLNKNSLKIIKDCLFEPSLLNAKPEDRFQFLRLGYFVADRIDFKKDKLVFNKTVSLKDTWAKVQNKNNE